MSDERMLMTDAMNGYDRDTLVTLFNDDNFFEIYGSVGDGEGWPLAMIGLEGAAVICKKKGSECSCKERLAGISVGAHESPAMALARLLPSDRCLDREPRYN